MVFKKIDNIKKITRCVHCGKKIIINNLNQKKCEDCGYHERERIEKQKYKNKEIED